MNGFDFELDDLTVNSDSIDEHRRGLNRDELVVLA